MSNHRYIFKLELMGGLALIQKEITADFFETNTDAGNYIFKSNNDDYCSGLLGHYPICNTIIVSIDENPDYEEPERRVVDLNIPREFEGGHF